MNYGYLGLKMKPSGDFNFDCYAFDGRIGLNCSCFIFYYNFYLGFGTDLPFIIEYFYLLKTYF